MDEIDFEQDSFEDILAKDPRYDAHAYALLADVIAFLGRDGKHMSGEAIVDEFKERALDQYGPMTYAVLTEWGLKATEDIGEMMRNFVEFHRIMRDEDDSFDSFAGAYDFKEAFLGPYRP